MFHVLELPSIAILERLEMRKRNVKLALDGAEQWAASHMTLCGTADCPLHVESTISGNPL
ncbi:hypothetical protein BJX62DRAFT_211538 [Aspergillus germanicus]